MPDNEQRRPLVLAKVVAQYLDCGVSTVYALAKEGRIPVISLGKKGVRFDLDAVVEALKRPRKK